MTKRPAKPVRTIAAVRRHVTSWRARGETIVFVPTMGALHAGHGRLITHGTGSGHRVIVSIFVNPLQFGPNEDFDAYPRALPADLSLCREAGADLVFLPAARDLFPEGFATRVHVDGLDSHLCGPFRPGHFDGVSTIVLKLLNIVQPDRLLLGQKDAQQAAIVGRMIRDLDLPVRLVRVPTVRERDGLAMSSRNRYLTAEERAVAPELFRALRAAADSIRGGERRPSTLLSAFRRRLSATPFRLQYAEIVDADTLLPMPSLGGRIVLAAAAFLGRARLIDNIQMTVGRPGTSAPKRKGVTR